MNFLNVFIVWVFLFCSFGCVSTHKQNLETTASQPAETKVLWQRLTKNDLEEIYSIIRQNHPGPLDTLNPSFNDWLEQGKKLAEKRIDSVTNFDGYNFVLKSYVEFSYFSIIFSSNFSIKFHFYLNFFNFLFNFFF